MGPIGIAISLLVIIGMPVVFLTLFLCTVRADRRESARVQQGWTAFARETGMSLSWKETSPNEPSLAGTLGGFAVTIESTLISVGGADTGSAPFTVVTLHLPVRSPLTFRLGQETSLSRIAAALGGQDVALDDHAFDRAFVVKSDQPAALERILTPEIRRDAVSSIERAKERVGQLTGDVMELTLDGEKLTWTTSGRVESPWELGREGFDMLVQIARNVVASDDLRAEG